MLVSVFQFYDNAWPKLVEIKSIVERNQKKKFKIDMFNSTLLHTFFKLHKKLLTTSKTYFAIK